MLPRLTSPLQRAPRSEGFLNTLSDNGAWYRKGASLTFLRSTRRSSPPVKGLFFSALGRGQFALILGACG